jgi:hypothetical protein
VSVVLFAPGAREEKESGEQEGGDNDERMGQICRFAMELFLLQTHVSTRK